MISRLLLICALCTSAISFTHQVSESFPSNPSPLVRDDLNVFITSDFIYWSGRLENLLDKTTYNNSSSTQLSSSATPITHTETINSSSHHPWAPGFKIGIGGNLRDGGWDTLLEYTWLHSHAYAQASATLSDNIGVHPSSSSTTPPEYRWHLHFNNINWMLGREFFIDSHLTLRPQIGIKGSWQKQFYSNSAPSTLDTLSFTPTNGADITQTTFRFHNKQSFWGVGVRMALDVTWLFNDTWSIFGSWAPSVLRESFHDTIVIDTTEVSENTSQTAVSTTSTTSYSSTIHTLSPIIDICLGMRITSLCCNDRYRIRGQIVWEQQIWFGHNRLLSLLGTPTGGNLNLHGIVAGLRVDF